MQSWELFLQKQEAELGHETVDKWLRTLKIRRFDACNIYLEAKDSFQALWFEEHIRSKVQNTLINGNNKQIKVHLTIANVPALSTKHRTKTKDTKILKGEHFQLTFDELDPHCLFQNFVINQENELTLKFLAELTEIPISKKNSTTPHHSSLGAWNPVYLYGTTGCGKTHLLMSLAQVLRVRGLKCIYVRAELFTDHVVTAIRAGEMNTFRQAYRNADALIVDDVHVFSRKSATQEEFFHTFNTLHLEGKQIILSANCAPQELQLIEPRLISRFEWGIVLSLKPLDLNERKKLLHTKSAAFNFPLATKIIDFLAEIFTSHPKSLVKAFEALMLRFPKDLQQNSHALTVAAAKILLADLLMEEQKSLLTSSKIVQAVAEYFGIRTEDILGKSQTRECVLPRQLAMHLCREKLKMPFMKIGDLFSRDHSTVMSAVKHIQKSIDKNHLDIASAWHTIEKKLQN